MSHADDCPRRHGEHINTDHRDLLCDPCRAWLLGDTGTDPAPRPPEPTWQEQVWDAHVTRQAAYALLTMCPPQPPVWADNDWHERAWTWWADSHANYVEVDTTELDDLLARIDQHTEATP